MFADIIFIMFASLLLLGAVGVISVRNPMHSVLFLVFTFFNAAGLFLLLGAEFLGLLLVMVYVGAIAVMFLFVLMTINIDFALVREGFSRYIPLGLLLGMVLLAEIGLGIRGGLFSGENLAPASLALEKDMSNIMQIGTVLFTNYVYPFIAVSIILLVAMIGAIVLTHRRRPDSKRQNISEQLSRKREDCIEILDVPTGKGIE